MPPKCSSSSVICFENTTLFMFLVIACAIMYYVHHYYLTNQTTIIKEHHYNAKKNNDIFDNPYVAPLKNNYFPPIHDNNMKSSFQQLGFLINKSKENTPIALLGRPIQSNRDKWQYYCITDQYNSIKIPLLIKGKNSMNEYGCNELNNNDEVVMVGTKEKCKVNLYDNYY